MKVELWEIAKPIPYARNPRRNEEAVAKVASSIKEFGWRQPIVVDSEGIIIAGHTRLLAAQKLGLSQVPVHIATELTPQQIKAYRLADNRVAEEAEWDKDLLSLELEELQEDGFNLDLIGFDEDELSNLLSQEAEELEAMPELQNGDKLPFQQKAFTLHDEQAATVDDAISLARTNPLADTGLNENSNGNALALICGQWLESRNG